MSATKCQSVRDAMVAYLLETTVGEQIGDVCVVTLPIPTIDGRFVDVFVESRIGDYLLVHDGGKAANELILQRADPQPSDKRIKARLCLRDWARVRRATLQ